jgi:hypothetical protein
MGLEDWLRGLLGKATIKAAESEVAGKVVDAAADKALREAKEAVSKAGDAMLDDLETALLGKKGAADEVLKSEGDVDALERARKAYGLDGGKAAPTAKELEKDREDRARAELAELKKKMGKT